MKLNTAKTREIAGLLYGGKNSRYAQH